MSSIEASDEERAKQRKMRHDKMVAELLEDYYADVNARINGAAEKGGNSELSLANAAGRGGNGDGDAGGVDNVARQRQLRHTRMVAELLSDYDAEYGANDKLFIEHTLAGLKNDAELSRAGAPDAVSAEEIDLLLAIETDSDDDDAVENDEALRPYVHPYTWKCVDDGDHKGCGLLTKTRPDMEKHRQSKTHANGIALGAPDLGKGIRADGWHCVDDGDKPGCGAVLSMKNKAWSSAVHGHFASATHASRIAEWRRVDAEQNTADNAVSFAQRRSAFFATLDESASKSRKVVGALPQAVTAPYIWKCVDDGDHKGCGAVFKTNLTRYTQQHRQSKLRARGVALGAPDLSKGIRADGWHCVDDGDKPGCGTVLSMVGNWCTSAHTHLTSSTHASRIAELRGEHSRHHVCVDDGDHQGCGFVLYTDRPHLTQRHRQSKVHANAIAIGAPDMSKGIRADDWHCVDVGDKPGCGAVVSMKSNQWCSEAHNHIMSSTHTRRIAELRGEHPRHYVCVEDGDHQGCGFVLYTDRPHLRQRHRQSKVHANAIAIGAPDMSKGIRADGWHCLDDGDKPGCGAVLPMKHNQWCSAAHSHILNEEHAKCIAE
jgi:hypothetical protein